MIHLRRGAAPGLGQVAERVCSTMITDDSIPDSISGREEVAAGEARTIWGSERCSSLRERNERR
jgi:hypothetical protein